jgi:predicted nucleic acid-binding protein
LKVVLDADILIGALDGSDLHHSRSRQLFSGWHGQDATRLISVVNLSEVLIAPAAQQDRLRAAREAIGALGVAVHQPSEAIGVQAARLRARHPISLPDAYCLATASRTGGEVASFDRKVLRAAKAERIPVAATASPKLRDSDSQADVE